MELSEEIKSLLEKYRPTNSEKIVYNKEYETNYSPDDIIDVEQIDMHDDQTWLVETEPIPDDLHTWLYEEIKPKINTMTIIRDKSKIQNMKKQFDSRTFTRPKKSLARPSIEKYNEEYLKSEKHSPLCDVIDNYISSYKEEELTKADSHEKPLHFDLSQPISENIFEKIRSTSDLDSFQNMSPPSLVNSMCSSTFTNVMESSYIKNDPILREIRDADYSHEIFHDDPPLFQSITESCSSINSEVAENFVRKTLTSLNGTLKFNDSLHEMLNSQHTDEDNSDFILNEAHSENIDPNITQISVNGTFKKNDSKLNRTYDKEADNSSPNTKTLRICKGLSSTIEKDKEYLNNLGNILTDNDLEVNLNRTFDKCIDYNDKNCLNNTFRKSDYKNISLQNKIQNNFDETKNIMKLNETITIECNDADVDDDDHDDDEYFLDEKQNKRLSAEIDEFLNEKMNSTYEKEGLKLRTSHLSADSSDSLDRASSISNNSKEYGQMLMAEVDAIVEQQERSLQIMSTPKPAKSLNKLFDNTYLSPIPNLKEHVVSDSEISSDEFVGRSGLKLAAPKASYDRSVKSLSNIKYAPDNTKIRSINMLSSKGNETRLKGSYSNLCTTASRIGGSYTNLKTINSNLKGSYTNLQPLHRNLPNIPPREVKRDHNVTHTLEGSTKHEFKVPRNSVQQNAHGNDTFVKPQPRTSSLPRPVSSTGIPRPLSKIPAPKSRLPSARQLTRPTSKVNINDGLY